MIPYMLKYHWQTAASRPHWFTSFTATLANKVDAFWFEFGSLTIGMSIADWFVQDSCESKFAVSPRKGDAIVFYSQHPDGSVSACA